ncbi:MAG TPA: nuclear transport factor 2 family protein [Solirubrobacteraceae bacterium]|nr:nuclear transport factor 2 family protein [Solirubrobacteraceae bacterium]
MPRRARAHAAAALRAAAGAPAPPSPRRDVLPPLRPARCPAPILGRRRSSVARRVQRTTSTRSCRSSPTTACSPHRAGRAPGGRRLIGHEPVRKGFQARFAGIPGIYGDDRHWTCGDRGVSEWTLRGTTAAGEAIEVRGCDLFEFSDGKISRKDSFWKIVE